MLERAPFIDGVTPFPAKNQINPQEIASIASSFVSAANGFFSKLELKINSIPTVLEVPYILGIGEKAKLSVISFQ